MKMSKKELDSLNEFDAAAERAGGYIDKKAVSPAYQLRNMHKWCLAHGREVESLTPEEREMFRAPSPELKAL
jgi:hypothetical protein